VTISRTYRALHHKPPHRCSRKWPGKKGLLATEFSLQIYAKLRGQQCGDWRCNVLRNGKFHLDLLQDITNCEFYIRTNRCIFRHGNFSSTTAVLCSRHSFCLYATVRFILSPSRDRSGRDF